MVEYMTRQLCCSLCTPLVYGSTTVVLVCRVHGASVRPSISYSCMLANEVSVQRTSTKRSTRPSTPPLMRAVDHSTVRACADAAVHAPVAYIVLPPFTHHPARGVELSLFSPSLLAERGLMCPGFSDPPKLRWAPAMQPTWRPQTVTMMKTVGHTELCMLASNGRVINQPPSTPIDLMQWALSPRQTIGSLSHPVGLGGCCTVDT